MDESRPVEHETRDVSVRAIVRFGVGLVVAAAIISVGLWGLFRFFQERAEKRDRRSGTTLASTRPVEAPRSPEQIFREPRLERFPFAARENLQREEEALLHGYGWVDPRAGVVRIPIERAMELIAERGVPPARPAAPPAPAAPAAAAPPTTGRPR